MKCFLVAEGNDVDQVWYRRFIHSLELSIIEPSDVLSESQMCLFILSGSHLSRLSTDWVDNILQNRSSIMIMPPYHYPCEVLSYYCGQIDFVDTEYQQLIVLDTQLKEIIGKDYLRLFYQQSVISEKGKRLLASQNSSPLLIAIQPSSSGGIIFISSLLLSSLSARSNDQDKKVFWDSLQEWIIRNSSKENLSIAKPELQDQLCSDNDFRLIILAINISKQSNRVLESDFNYQLMRICEILKVQYLPTSKNIILNELNKGGKINMDAIGTWIIDSDWFDSELIRLHMTSYLRRLQ